MPTEKGFLFNHCHCDQLHCLGLYIGTVTDTKKKKTRPSQQRGKTPPTSVRDMTLNNLMVELSGKRSTSSLSSLPSPLWLEVVVLDWVLFMG